MRVTYAQILIISALALSACGPAKWRETAGRFTGDPVADAQKAPTDQRGLQNGDVGYVNPERLRGAESPEMPIEDAKVVLDQGDEVKVIDATPQGPDNLIKVEVPETTTEPARTVYVPPSFINLRPVAKNKYFVIENIATERLRVYERCTASPDCPHRLVFETETVVGEDTGDRSRRSRVGNYVIDTWHKFYEDGAKLYPSWTALGPALPPAGAPLEDWISTSLIPANYNSQETRAAFGWFTAKIRPNAKEQWTHGTWGHGADGDKFIRAVKRSNDLRLMSHGCTRVENRAIALMHEMLPAGTKIIKIYAREERAEPTRQAGSVEPWSWILTTEGAGKAGLSMSEKSVLARRVPESSILERGTYAPAQIATAVKGNVYNIDENEFRGKFIVDEGRLEGYLHPVSLEVGGYQDRGAMPAMAKRTTPKNRTRVAGRSRRAV